MSSSVGVCHRVCVQYMISWLTHAHTCTCTPLLALSQQWMCVKDGWILHSTSQNTKLQGSLLVDNPLFSAPTWFQNTSLVAHQQNPAIIWYNSVGNHHWSNKEYLNWRNEHSEPYQKTTSKFRQKFLKVISLEAVFPDHTVCHHLVLPSINISPFSALGEITSVETIHFATIWVKQITRFILLFSYLAI